MELNCLGIRSRQLRRGLDFVFTHAFEAENMLSCPRVRLEVSTKKMHGIHFEQARCYCVVINYQANSMCLY